MNLYNRYRPTKFADVAQPHVVKILQAQAAAKNPTSVYLMVGPPGTGKTTLARIIAMSLCCQNLSSEGEPCGKCDPCIHIHEDSHRDVIEMNAADTNGVDDVRTLIAERMRIAPTHGDKRIYIMDEAHSLTTQAQNALLKIFEEPPPYVVFILCTTEINKVLPAIRSRCQTFLLKRVTDAAARLIVQNVAKLENLAVEDGGIDLIVEAADGNSRTALQILEQVAPIGVTEGSVRDVLGLAPGAIAIALLAAIGKMKRQEAYMLIDTAQKEGRDLGALAKDSAQILMGKVAKAKLLKTPNTHPGLAELELLYNGNQMIDTVQQLLEIHTKIRQNVPAETIMKSMVLRIIDRFAKLKEAPKTS